MKGSTKSRAFFLPALCALLPLWCSMAAAATVQTAAAHAVAPAPVAAIQVEAPLLAGVLLKDEQGRAVDLPAELGRPGPVFLNFVFTSCEAVCPVMTALFARLDRQLRAQGSEARLYSISIDPHNDTPARLREYAAEHRASAQWRFLTGTVAASDRVQRAFGAWRADRMNHPVATYYQAQPGAGWVRVDGFVPAETLLAMP
jgi:protein SCO1/2